MPRYECRTARIGADITTFKILAKMCWVSTKLYNTALWTARQEYKENGKTLSKYDLQKVLLDSYFHDYVPAHTYQHCAHQVRQAYDSFFALLKKDSKAHPPGFRSKNDLSTIMFTSYGFKVKDATHVELTLGQKLKDELDYPNRKLTLTLAWNNGLPPGLIKQIEIVPKEGYFELHAKVQVPEPDWKEEGQVSVVDLGEKRPITSWDEDGNLDMFEGGSILSNMQYFNKTKADIAEDSASRVKGKKNKSKVAHSKTIKHLWKKGEAKKKQEMNALTNTYVNLCVERNAKEVVVGNLKGIKKDKKTGKGKNWRKPQKQAWQQFPIRTLVAQLRYKLAREGIRLKEQDERGTSKNRCCLCGCTDKKKLHRVHRGLFRCDNCNSTINADVNGVGNQFAKYLQREAPVSRSSSGCLAQPSVWRFDNHSWRMIK